ncbi:MAG TPA: hypothetical protein VFM70_09120 [Salinimicrobium sp.]|nr:hypothetical protein [Salinimicrobium sp.]
MMKINIRTNISFAAIAGLLLMTSCANSEEYDFAGSDKPVVTAPTTTFTVAEGETLMIPIEVSETINKPLDFKLVVVDGTATKDVDYSGGDPMPGDWGDPNSAYGVRVPAYAESFEIPFTAIADLVPQEGTETVTLRLETAGIRNAVTPEGGITFTINIAEVMSEDFVIRLDWDAEYTDADGEHHSFCDYDLDIEIYDAATGGIVATSYTSCPEEIRITPGDLPNGDYLLVPSYWSPAGAAMPVDYEGIPAVVTMAKPGVFAETVDLSSVWTDLAAGAAEGNPDAYQPVALLNINGTTYTLTDLSTGEVIVQGKMSGFQPSYRGTK